MLAYWALPGARMSERENNEKPAHTDKPDKNHRINNESIMPNPKVFLVGG